MHSGLKVDIRYAMQYSQFCSVHFVGYYHTWSKERISVIRYSGWSLKISKFNFQLSRSPSIVNISVYILKKFIHSKSRWLFYVNIHKDNNEMETILLLIYWKDLTITLYKWRRRMSLGSRQIMNYPAISRNTNDSHKLS